MNVTMMEAGSAAAAGNGVCSGDHADIGLCPEDAESDAILTRAMAEGLVPCYVNPHGAYLEVVFQRNNFYERQGEGEGEGESAVGKRLYGFVEAVPSYDSIAIAARVPEPSRPSPSSPGGGSKGSDSDRDSDALEDSSELFDSSSSSMDSCVSDTSERHKKPTDFDMAAATMAAAARAKERRKRRKRRGDACYRVVSNVDFLLRLWSTPHSRRGVVLTAAADDEEPEATPGSREGERKRREENEDVVANSTLHGCGASLYTPPPLSGTDTEDKDRQLVEPRLRRLLREAAAWMDGSGDGKSSDSGSSSDEEASSAGSDSPRGGGGDGETSRRRRRARERRENGGITAEVIEELENRDDGQLLRNAEACLDAYVSLLYKSVGDDSEDIVTEGFDSEGELRNPAVLTAVEHVSVKRDGSEDGECEYIHFTPS